ncbi:EVE domain-containing protein [Aminobacter carboxidus]|uniref:EVE domain-containing protein n=1 Tax=Aminobacter carboxidus TaxID=376165 RepID=UPI001FE90495|nr:EVE domain-containing protein [Aminobacter carboxidus]
MSTANWLAVASAEHVRRGRSGGFMQVCHGKAGPLRRIMAGDGVVYYSPATVMGGEDELKSFTAIGHVRSGDAYQFDMGGGFLPSRAIPGKVRSGFPSGIAQKQEDREIPRFEEKRKFSRRDVDWAASNEAPVRCCLGGSISPLAATGVISFVSGFAHSASATSA